MKQNFIERANFLNSFRREKLDERRFRQFDYVLILFLIVAVNKFLKREISHSLFYEVTVSCYRGLYCSHALVFATN